MGIINKGSLASAFVDWSRQLRGAISGGKSNGYWHEIGRAFGGAERQSDSELIDSGLIVNGTFYSIVNKVSQLASRLPYDIHKRTDGGETERLVGDYAKFLQTLNSDLGRREFLYQTFMNLLPLGDAFLAIEQVAVGFKEYRLVPLPAHLVEIEKESRSYLSPVKRYKFNDGVKQRYYEPDEIIHLKFYDPSAEGARTGRGLSPFQPGFLSVQAGNNANIANAKVFENGGPQHFVFNKKGGVVMGAKDKKAIDEANRKRFGGAHDVGLVRHLTGDGDIKKVGSTPAELGTDNAKKQILRELCNVIGTNSSEWNDPDNKIYNSAKLARQATISDAAIPLFEVAMEKIVLKTAHLFGLDPFDIMPNVLKDQIDALTLDPLERSKLNLSRFEKGSISKELYLKLEKLEDDGKLFVKHTTHAPASGGQNNQDDGENDE